MSAGGFGPHTHPNRLPEDASYAANLIARAALCRRRAPHGPTDAVISANDCPSRKGSRAVLRTLAFVAMQSPADATAAPRYRPEPASKIRRSRYRSRTNGATNARPHQRPMAQSTTMTMVIQTASSSRIASADFRCRRSQFIVAARYSQPAFSSARSRNCVPSVIALCEHLEGGRARCFLGAGVRWLVRQPSLTGLRSATAGRRGDLREPRELAPRGATHQVGGH